MSKPENYLSWKILPELVLQFAAAVQGVNDVREARGEDQTSFRLPLRRKIYNYVMYV